MPLPMQRNPMKAIIFDCDGVLIDSEILYHEVQMHKLSEIGLRYDAQTFADRFTGSGEKLFRKNAGADYQKLYNKDILDSFWDELNTYKKEVFSTRLQTVSGIPALLESLSPVPLAIASSSNPVFLLEKLEWTKLKHFFGDHIYSGQNVPVSKPAPDIFLHTMEKMNCKPDECLVIEDSINGVKAGKAAGIHTIGFCGGSHCAPDHPDKLKQAGADEISMSVNDLKQILSSYI